MKLFFIFTLIGYLSGFSFFQSYIKALPVNSYSQNIQAAVLFTGGSGRLERGAEYLKKVANKPLLITGVNSKITMDILLKENIIPAKDSNRVELDYSAIDTIDNVKTVKKWAIKNSFNNIALITSAYHTPRSLLLFDRTTPYLKNLKITPISVKNTKTSQLYLFKEYNKYLYTYIFIK